MGDLAKIYKNYYLLCKNDKIKKKSLIIRLKLCACIIKVKLFY